MSFITDIIDSVRDEFGGENTEPTMRDILSKRRPEQDENLTFHERPMTLEEQNIARRHGTDDEARIRQLQKEKEGIPYLGENVTNAEIENELYSVAPHIIGAPVEAPLRAAGWLAEKLGGTSPEEQRQLAERRAEIVRERYAGTEMPYEQRQNEEWAARANVQQPTSLGETASNILGYVAQMGVKPGGIAQPAQAVFQQLGANEAQAEGLGSLAELGSVLGLAHGVTKPMREAMPWQAQRPSRVNQRTLEGQPRFQRTPGEVPAARPMPLAEPMSESTLREALGGEAARQPQVGPIGKGREFPMEAGEQTRGGGQPDYGSMTVEQLKAAKDRLQPDWSKYAQRIEAGDQQAIIEWEQEQNRIGDEQNKIQRVINDKEFEAQQQARQNRIRASSASKGGTPPAPPAYSPEVSPSVLSEAGVTEGIPREQPMSLRERLMQGQRGTRHMQSPIGEPTGGGLPPSEPTPQEPNVLPGEPTPHRLGARYQPAEEVLGEQRSLPAENPVTGHPAPEVSIREQMEAARYLRTPEELNRYRQLRAQGRPHDAALSDVMLEFSRGGRKASPVQTGPIGTTGPMHPYQEDIENAFKNIESLRDVRTAQQVGIPSQAAQARTRMPNPANPAEQPLLTTEPQPGLPRPAGARPVASEAIGRVNEATLAGEEEARQARERERQATAAQNAPQPPSGGVPPILPPLSPDAMPPGGDFSPAAKKPLASQLPQKDIPGGAGLRGAIGAGWNAIRHVLHNIMPDYEERFLTNEDTQNRLRGARQTQTDNLRNASSEAEQNLAYELANTINVSPDDVEGRLKALKTQDADVIARTPEEAEAIRKYQRTSPITRQMFDAWQRYRHGARRVAVQMGRLRPGQRIDAYAPQYGAQDFYKEILGADPQQYLKMNEVQRQAYLADIDSKISNLTPEQTKGWENLDPDQLREGVRDYLEPESKLRSRLDPTTVIPEKVYVPHFMRRKGVGPTKANLLDAWDTYGARVERSIAWDGTVKEFERLEDSGAFKNLPNLRDYIARQLRAQTGQPQGFLSDSDVANAISKFWRTSVNTAVLPTHPVGMYLKHISTATKFPALLGVDPIRATRALAEGYTQWAKAWKDPDAMAELAKQGMLGTEGLKQIMGAERGGILGAMNEIATLPARGGIAAVKAPSYLAALWHFKNGGWTPELEARYGTMENAARRIAEMTVGRYSTAALPQVFQGPVGKAAFHLSAPAFAGWKAWSDVFKKAAKTGDLKGLLGSAAMLAAAYGGAKALGYSKKQAGEMAVGPGMLKPAAVALSEQAERTSDVLPSTVSPEMDTIGRAVQAIYERNPEQKQKEIRSLAEAILPFGGTIRQILDLNQQLAHGGQAQQGGGVQAAFPVRGEKERPSNRPRESGLQMLYRALMGTTPDTEVETRMAQEAGREEVPEQTPIQKVHAMMQGRPQMRPFVTWAASAEPNQLSAAANELSNPEAKQKLLLAGRTTNRTLKTLFAEEAWRIENGVGR